MHLHSKSIRRSSLLLLLLASTTKFIISKDIKILSIKLKKLQWIQVKIVIITSSKDSILTILKRIPSKAKNLQRNHQLKSVKKESQIKNKEKSIKNF